MKIIVEKSAWQKFIRRAKARFPKEYMECIWGIETVDSFRIVKFNKVPHTSTGCSIEYDDEEAAKQKAAAKEAGLTSLGSVHTHPYYADCSASQTDHEQAIVDGDKLMGIVGLTKSKDGRITPHTQWWIPQPAMNFILVDDE